MTHHRELLLTAARTVLDGEETRRLEALLRRTGDWEALYRQAGAQGVLPLLSFHVKERFAGIVPPDFLERTQTFFLRNYALNRFRFGELVRLCRLLAEESGQVVPYRGLVLAATVYGDLSLRPGGDFDLIVRREDLPRAKKAVEREGYRPLYELAGRRERAYLRYYRSETLMGGNGMNVDLHWEMGRCIHPSLIGPLALGDRLTTVVIEGEPLPSLAPEDLLIILAVHGCKHRWERIMWIADVSELLRRRDLAWTALYGEAERVGAVRALDTALLLARDLLGAELPAEAAGRAEGNRAAAMLAAVVSDDYGVRTGAGKGKPTMGSSSYQLRSLDRIRDRARMAFLWTVEPNINDWTWISLPDPLTPLYYLLRPLRLAFLYGGRVLGISRRASGHS